MSKIIQIAEELYAIVRVDNYHDSDVEIENKITVKCVVSSYDFAKSEVERLNKLNNHKGCFYFFQYTRYLNKDRNNHVP